MPHSFFTDRRPQNGLTYEEYLAVTHERGEQDVTGLPEEEAEKIEYTKLNLHRMQRIKRTYEVSEELRQLIERVETPQLWMVLTEPWCSDSAQCLPFIAAMSELNDKIDLRMLLRDDNLDVMDLYLTNGSRGVPLLVSFDSDGAELFRWGPRPKPAQEVFNQAKIEGIEKPKLLERILLFYGRDRGRAIEAEFIALLGL